MRTIKLSFLSLLVFLPMSVFAANGSKEILTLLVQTNDPKAEIKAPLSIDVENVQCWVGAKDSIRCEAMFSNNGKMDKKEITNSHAFFNNLKKSGAIGQTEIMFGGGQYVAEKISCSYTLESQPYYSCSSKVTVKF